MNTDKHGLKIISLVAGILLAVPTFAAETNSPKVQAAQVLYENNLEKSEAGKLAEEFMVQEGNFVVKDLETNKVLELPGAPLETFGLFFGPTEGTEVLVSAKILGTSK